jgi:hypothetical protein
MASGGVLGTVRIPRAPALTNFSLGMGIMNDSGRTWAYIGLGLGFSASITANIASTVLTETSVSLWLRTPFAVFWPLATYVAIEVLVRTRWTEKNWSHIATRLVLVLPVGAVAAFVSYLHQHHLMILAGEPGLAQAFGPLAVDGMLFGMTARLIINRTAEKVEEISSAAEMLPGGVISSPQVVEISPEETQELREKFEEYLHPEKETPAEIRPVSVAPISPAVPRAPRALRSTWDAAKVIDMLLEGRSKAEILSVSGISPASYGRISKVLRVLREDRGAAIDYRAEKVSEEHVDMMRKALAR